MSDEEARTCLPWFYKDFEWESEETKLSVDRERHALLIRAGAIHDKTISYEEIIEGETQVRLSASYALVAEGLMRPDMRGGIILTEEGQRMLIGMRALGDWY